MKVCIVAGARPNFVKVAPIIRAIEKAQTQGRNIDYTLVYAGTPTDPTIEDSLFDNLQMPRPNVYLNVDSNSLNEITGRVIGEFERYLNENKTDTVIVVDDLASTMATAIVAKKHGLRLAHLVAGTRSFDMNMPKEVNRMVIDGLSDLLFTAGVGANSIVSREGAQRSKVYMVGNILIDSLRYNMHRFQRPKILEQNKIADREYLVFTINRKALIADRENLTNMLKAMTKAANDTPIIAPLRGTAAETIKELISANGINEENRGGILFTKPLPYLEFSYITTHAKGIITDSGNVAEEATFNNVPCITLNSYTEHIETVRKGTNLLVGEDPQKLSQAVSQVIDNQWKQTQLPDRWDGRSAERIVQILLDRN